jgi:histidinol phosphatase-like PHP family hydrolase
MTHNTFSRRHFLSAMAAGAASIIGRPAPADDFTPPPGLDFPLVDFHVHVEKEITIERAVHISRQRGVKFGVVEHAGARENKYPRVLSSDEELKRYLDDLERWPVYRGVQAEFTDWMAPFSKEMVARLDYVLIDAMTMPGPHGRRQKLWEGGYEIGDKQKWMDRYAEYHEEIMASGPVRILANTSWLPAPLEAEYDALWTAARMRKVIDAALRHRVALEISSSYKRPKEPFLRMAKEAGAKFSFGSNIRGPQVGTLDYCVAMARKIGLKRADMFTPAPRGRKAEGLKNEKLGGTCCFSGPEEPLSP